MDQHVQEALLAELERQEEVLIESWKQEVENYEQLLGLYSPGRDTYAINQAFQRCGEAFQKLEQHKKLINNIKSY